MNFQDNQTRDEEVTLELTPLIDMVFQLLIFFLLTTTFAINVKESGLEVDLPRAKSTEISSMSKHITIAILKDGRTVIGGETLSDQALHDKLVKIYKDNPDTMVVVQADKSVNHGIVVKTMDTAATIGLKKLAIATMEE
ncbi:MAG: biopolymer transporter ExbD [Deltaproteobacteria bacterium]|nr:biopolymer transporter ExbD [Deltaproteobacteria bacterium]MBW1870911.1 biopolymer transporter ExbD [Deltaproteobacteria bacterium]